LQQELKAKNPEWRETRTKHVANKKDNTQDVMGNHSQIITQILSTHCK